MDKETLEGLQQLTNLVLKNTLAIIEIKDEIDKIYNRLIELTELNKKEAN